jgi:superfamily II DNA/RNA helicase
MTTFAALGLPPELIKACRKQGFREPTPIQAMVVPHVLKGADVVVEAKTGSGKTLAYGLPLLARTAGEKAGPRALVVVPTRELAEQVARALEAVGGPARQVALLTGRGGMDKQRQALEAGAQVAVGTLGRIEELVARSALVLQRVETVVLDEVDELLRGGFSGQLAALLGSLRRERQTLLFSATVPTEVEAVAKGFMRSPVRLRPGEAREQPAELTHRVLFTSVDDRIENLCGYLRGARPYQALVFCGTRHETEEVRTALHELGLEAEFLHGELSPLKRRQLLDKFRSGDLPVLVASDLAARGLDLPGVDLVVNYSLPDGSAAYLHRAGRTGRAGRPGTVLSLVIGQQHARYERLRETFAFESAEVSSRGKVFTHPSRTREERDRRFGKPKAKG